MPICNKCNISLPEEAFGGDGYRRLNGLTGKRKTCKFCMRAKNKAWRAAHKAEYTAYNKNRRAAAKANQVPKAWTTEDAEKYLGLLPFEDKSIPTHVSVPAPASVEPIQDGSLLGTEAGPVS